jgi:hypothetical protein
MCAPDRSGNSSASSESETAGKGRQQTSNASMAKFNLDGRATDRATEPDGTGSTKQVTAAE